MEALMVEREEEKLHFIDIQKNKGIKQRVREGVSMYPLQVEQSGLSYGSHPFVILRKHPDQQGGGSIQNSSSVSLFRLSETEEERFSGRVLNIQKDKIKVLIYSDDLPADLKHGKWGLDLMFDDKSYEAMAFAMNQWINEEKPERQKLRDTILAYKEPGFKTVSSFEIPSLNTSQNEALMKALSAEHIAVVHGPPGTGKTTTLTEVVKQLQKSEKQVLVCAPSNTAVDLLTSNLLAEGFKVVRIGNSPKIDEDNLPFTLNHQIKNHKDFKFIQQYQRQADELHSMALKYKRQFGKAERDQRKRLFQEVKELRQLARMEEKHLIDQILDDAEVISSTLIGSYDIKLKDRTFQTVIIDEAGQALEPGVWLPILKAEKVILAGDPLQLPPTIKSEKAASMGLRKTLIEKVIDRSPSAITLLKEQYRMNTKIMQFSSDYFYNGELQAHASVAEHQMEDQVVEWIDTAGCGYDEDKEGEGSSLTNPGEADVLIKHLDAFEERHGHMEIGVISPYRAQVELLRERLQSRRNITIQTVDGFQGQERDVVYISLVRSNEEGNIGFLKDHRRMNVAMTRARKKLVMIGDSATIGNDSFYETFLDYIETINAYHSAWEWA